MKTKKTIVCGFLAVVLMLAFGACTKSSGSESGLKSPSASKEQRLTGPTDSFKFTVINGGTAYSVSAGTATEGTVIIPDYYRPNEDSEYLPVTAIAYEAFKERKNIIRVTIPSTVTSIGDYAFRECTNLIDITISSSITSIGDWAFLGCSSLTGITVDSQNPAYSSVDGVLFNKNRTVLIQYPIGKQEKSYTIPSSVTSIGEGAFIDCYNLESITIPSSVTSIGNEAFAGCTSLISITIPSSVTSIGDMAFQWCTSLTSITLSEGVTRIGNNTFSFCSSLPSITIPSSVTSIGFEVFYDCTKLTSVTMSRRTTFGRYSFPDNARITYSD